MFYECINLIIFIELKDGKITKNELGKRGIIFKSKIRILKKPYKSDKKIKKESYHKKW